MKGRRFISDQFRPFLCRVGNCAELSAQRARRWAWGGGIGTVWKGPQQITRPTLDGDREPGWDVWQPVPSRPVSFCHVPGEVLPSIDYPHCKKILSYIRTEPLLVRPVPIAPCLLVFSTRLVAALQLQEPCTEVPPGPAPHREARPSPPVLAAGFWGPLPALSPRAFRKVVSSVRSSSNPWGPPLTGWGKAMDRPPLSVASPQTPQPAPIPPVCLQKGASAGRQLVCHQIAPLDFLGLVQGPGCLQICQEFTNEWRT